ncbi:hypothetical protein CAAN1_23S01640 [[Candida] anglica]|uniref:Uncharacterized protein n=1 Tax=[Candida] anglica TaxID=148631 RepID=A0ABP0EA54_9ASCO
MSEPESDPNFQRRPNPKGWTPPKAPYNPYDPTDARPAGGYPSEYKIPGNSPSGFSSLPRDPTQYKKVNETMKRLNYTPRPASSLYPGQYKVLRKINTNIKVQTGSRWFGTFLGGSIVVYFSFFYRWNDGKENVFSDFYRARLSIKERIFGLDEQEYDDLYHPRESRVIIKKVRDAEYIPEDMRKYKESDMAMHKPSDRHFLEAERIKQDQEEQMLRELDEHRKFALEMLGEDDQQQIKTTKKKWWIF